MPRIGRKLSLGKICGPILEVQNGYIQFVHFTAKEYAEPPRALWILLRLTVARYLTSPKVPGNISLEGSVLSLVTGCVTYLSQRQHDPILSDHDIEGYVRNGNYTLHNFATTMWHQLLEDCINICSLKSPPVQLVALLEDFKEERTNKQHQADAEPRYSPTLSIFQDASESLWKFLLDAYQFRLECTSSVYSLGSGMSPSNSNHGGFVLTANRHIMDKQRPNHTFLHVHPNKPMH